MSKTQSKGESKEKEEGANWHELLPSFIPVVNTLLIVYIDQVYQNHFFGFWIFYVLIPILDTFVPLDFTNYSGKKLANLEKDKRFLIPLYIQLFLDSFLLFAFLAQVRDQGTVSLDHPLHFMLICYLLGSGQGSTILLGHELLHRRETIHKVFGTMCFGKHFFSHYFIQHVRSHHKDVGTEVDSSTGRLNESFYAFFVRAVSQGLRIVWNYESNRLQKQKKSNLSLENRLISFNILHALYLIAIYNIFGFTATLVHLGCSFCTILQLEMGNYIEHYGLKRNRDKDGILEPIDVTHSWNAAHYISNHLLFKIQRHSDHHALMYKPYQALNTFKESPQLPHSYSLCFLLAYMPPLFFKVMNPLALAALKKERPSKKVMEEINKIVYTLMVVVAGVLSYLILYVDGFK